MGVVRISSKHGRILIATAVALLALLAAPAAMAIGDGAASSAVTQDQYDDSAERFGTGDGTGDPSTVGSLPFTGLDLGLMAVGAAGLVAAGVLMRRRARPGSSEG